MYINICLWLLIFVLFLLFIKQLNLQKNQIISILITAFIIIFILNINVSIQSALTGLSLVIKAILPTLFPFSVICNLLICYDGITLYSKILGPILCKPLRLSKSSSFPIAASVFCGYPLGCKYACDIYDQGHISRNEFERLLNIATNASPIFLLGSVSVAMLYNIKYGFILLIANYISPIIIGILTINKSEKQDTIEYIPESSNVNFGTAIKFSIENAINTTLQVGAFVIIFSIIIGIIKNNAYIGIVFYKLEDIFNLPNTTLYGLFLGSIESTNGCKLISNSNLSIIIKLSIISFINSFSGLSIIGQVTSFLGKYNVSIKKYSAYKLLQGIFSFLITFVASNLLLKTETASNIVITQNKIYYIILISLYLILSLPLLVKYFIYLLKKLHIS